MDQNNKEPNPTFSDVQYPEPEFAPEPTPTEPPATDQTLPSDYRDHRAEFHGNAYEYFKIWIVNALLIIVTLGLYSPWAKVRNLKYLYGRTKLDGSRFDFHGDPINILKGRIIAVALGGLYFFGGYYSQLLALTGFLLLFLMMPFLVVNSIRFRLASTSFRNVRFGFTGTVKEGYRIWFKYVTPLVIITTVNILYSYYFINPLKMDSKLQALNDQWPLLLMGVTYFIYFLSVVHKFYAAVINFVYNNIRYGKTKFNIHTDSKLMFKNVFKPVYIDGFIFLFIGIITVFGSVFLATSISTEATTFAGIISASFVYLCVIAGFLNFGYMLTQYVWSNLNIGPYPTYSRIKFRSYCFIAMTNIFAVGLSFGLLFPWSRIRFQKYLIENRGLMIDTFDRFQAEESSSQSSVGEEVTDAMDFNFEIGL